MTRLTAWRSMLTASGLAALTLTLALLPSAALADAGQAVARQPGFDGTIDVQPGSIEGRVVLESGSVDLQAQLAESGPQGHLQIVVPGTFVGATNVGGGALSYQLEACGPGVTVALSGTRNAGLHFAFRDAAADPARCTTLPATPSAALEMSMGVFAPADAQTAQTTTDSGNSALTDWLRRLVGFTILGTLLVFFIPGMPGILAATTQTAPWGRIGIGLALAFLMPLLGLVGFALLLPLGLWWLGLLILAIYPVLLILSLSVSGLALGSLLLTRVGRGRVPPVAAYAAGIIIISIASVLPFLGPLVNVAGVIFGLGTLALAPRTRAAVLPPPTRDDQVASSDRVELPAAAPVAAG